MFVIPLLQVLFGLILGSSLIVHLRTQSVVFMLFVFKYMTDGSCTVYIHSNDAQFAMFGADTDADVRGP